MALTYHEVRDMALALPGATEGTSYGTAAVHVGRKLILRLREDGETLVLKVDPAARGELLDRFPDAFFLTDHYRAYPYVLVYLPAATADALRLLVAAAWSMVASKRQLASAQDPASKG